MKKTCLQKKEDGFKGNRQAILLDPKGSRSEELLAGVKSQGGLYSDVNTQDGVSGSHAENHTNTPGTRRTSFPSRNMIYFSDVFCLPSFLTRT